MTTTLPSNVTALPANQDAPAVSDRMAAFMADELLPLMAGSWPASANQLDANARGVAMAWGGVLRGFTPGQIREVVQNMAADADRQFAPRPAEVRAEILRRLPAEVVTGDAPASQHTCEVSMSALKMRAKVKSGDYSCGSAYEAALQLEVAIADGAGVKITNNWR